jgi:hypothetical protein
MTVMSEEVRVVKSPLAYGVDRLPATKPIGSTIFVMLPSGIVITNTDQFEDDETQAVEAYSENSEYSMAP